METSKATGEVTHNEQEGSTTQPEAMEITPSVDQVQETSNQHNRNLRRRNPASTDQTTKELLQMQERERRLAMARKRYQYYKTRKPRARASIKEALLKPILPRPLQPLLPRPDYVCVPTDWGQAVPLSEAVASSVREGQSKKIFLLIPQKSNSDQLPQMVPLTPVRLPTSEKLVVKPEQPDETKDQGSREKRKQVEQERRFAPLRVAPVEDKTITNFDDEELVRIAEVSECIEAVSKLQNSPMPKSRKKRQTELARARELDAMLRYRKFKAERDAHSAKLNRNVVDSDPDSTSHDNIGMSAKNDSNAESQKSQEDSERLIPKEEEGSSDHSMSNCELPLKVEILPDQHGDDSTDQLEDSGYEVTANEKSSSPNDMLSADVASPENITVKREAIQSHEGGDTNDTHAASSILESLLVKSKPRLPTRAVGNGPVKTEEPTDETENQCLPKDHSGDNTKDEAILGPISGFFEELLSKYNKSDDSTSKEK